ncbi:hypothetical protein HPB48_008023 [Haemaphysalis longicornis]|uniref:Uncharacterized protein n=1 Tax=Haemaphysalis longicornis TaxID=44386 RepID=A0A9J6FZX5_HAELO|nr:hypothetical protein HPB48_008023 [Haemaphysalis longicornis]
MRSHTPVAGHKCEVCSRAFRSFYPLENMPNAQRGQVVRVSRVRQEVSLPPRGGQAHEDAHGREVVQGQRVLGRPPVTGTPRCNPNAHGRKAFPLPSLPYVLFYLGQDPKIPVCAKLPIGPIPYSVLERSSQNARPAHYLLFKQYYM